ncbi:MAG: cytidine deaminase [Verrucomicrobiota bacterium]
MKPKENSRLSQLKSQLEDPNFTGCLVGIQKEDTALVDEALSIATTYAIIPISGFRVGALAFGSSGKCYLGANMEITGAPLNASLHAEQSAVLNAWMHGELAIDSLFVSELPCGHCRQFLLELHDAANLIIVTRGTKTTLSDLIPNAFGDPRPKGHGLLDGPGQPVVIARPTDRDNDQRAVNAASKSYAPYTNSPEGFVIESISGHRFIGRAAESVAFNPSVPAVITALNQRNLSAHRKDYIDNCTHAKLATALKSTLRFSEAVIERICSARVESVLMESAD